MIDAMSDEEAEEFEQRRPWLAKAAAVIGSGLAFLVGIAKVAVASSVLLVAGYAASSWGLAAMAIVGIGIAVITSGLLNIEEHAESAHPRIAHGLDVVFFSLVYGIGIGFGLIGEGSPYAEEVLWISIGVMMVVLGINDLIFRADAFLHNRLFGEVSTS